MTSVVVKLKNLNIAPRKVKLVGESIKGLHVGHALAQLQSMSQRSSLPISKLLKSAIAAAKEKKMDETKLVVKSVRIDKGITLKRAKARARGRATLIERKMSHVILEIEERSDIVTPAFTYKEKEREVKKEKVRTKSEKPRGEEEVKREKARKGFKDKFFRRKSV